VARILAQHNLPARASLHAEGGRLTSDPNRAR
jgi:hypothetical protein